MRTDARPIAGRSVALLALAGFTLLPLGPAGCSSGDGETTTWTVGGQVAGLVGGGLVLQNNGADDLPVAGSGPFTFGGRLAEGATYLVTVRTQPSSPAQQCTVAGGSGTVGSGPVTGVVVTCSDPCAVGCGAVEQCDALHAGLDDDCDGQVDEGCGCVAGQAQPCFRGDASFLTAAGCFQGTQVCDAAGQWGACQGGVHAIDGCFQSDPGCHAITTAPFLPVDLADGTGVFAADAVPGTESWQVTCPDGVAPCPAASGSGFRPLQSGEYAVTYAKGLAGGGTDSCTYPLLVGVPGLRVELQWEHDLGGGGVDLDLHLHQPGSTQPWSIAGAPQDCGWGNCTVAAFAAPGAATPDWFDGLAPPDPVDWTLDPVLERNTCYFAPRGLGAQWSALGLGCHNPRLDLDLGSCDPAVTDPESSGFCGPENVNLDVPPRGVMTRIGVHHYSSNALGYDVHPRIKVFCGGGLAADLGPAGYASPQAPVTFTATSGSGQPGENRFWLVADVAYGEACQRPRCVVVPLHVDASTRAPVFVTGAAAEASFGPPLSTAP